MTFVLVKLTSLPGECDPQHGEGSLHEVMEAMIFMMIRDFDRNARHNGLRLNLAPFLPLALSTFFNDNEPPGKPRACQESAKKGPRLGRDGMEETAGYR